MPARGIDFARYSLDFLDVIAHCLQGRCSFFGVTFLDSSLREYILYNVVDADRKLVAPQPKLPVYQLCGFPASGKSKLLHTICANQILPIATLIGRDHRQGCIADEIFIGGQDNSVIFFDLDGKFNIASFVRLIKARIDKAFVDHSSKFKCDCACDADRIDPIIQSSLKNLHLYAIHDIPEFISTLSTLLDGMHEYCMSNVKLVLVDNISSFSMISKCESSYMKGRRSNTAEWYGAHIALIESFNRLINKYKLIGVVSHCLRLDSKRIVDSNIDNTLPDNYYSFGSFAVENQLPPIWNSIVTNNYLIESDESRLDLEFKACNATKIIIYQHLSDKGLIGIERGYIAGMGYTQYNADG